MLALERLESGDALEPVPDEGADAADVVVEPHLAVGQDVEAGQLLVLERRPHGVLERLLVRSLLERVPDVPTGQLVGEPGWPRVGAHEGGRQKRQAVHGWERS